MQKTRINKRMVELGLAPSRRKADELIVRGQLRLNGVIHTEPGTLISDQDVLETKTKAKANQQDIYVAYNKPKGLVCSHAGQGNQTIFDKLPKAFKNLKIAGRLDKDSEGLVLLSSDGNFVQQLSHPSGSKTKVYMVTTKQGVDKAALQKLNAGISLDDGISRLRAIQKDEKILKITMQEGRNRQIRRTLEAIDITVVKLERIKLGNYSMRSLAPGSYQFVRPEDVL